MPEGRQQGARGRHQGEASRRQVGKAREWQRGEPSRPQPSEAHGRSHANDVPGHFYAECIGGLEPFVVAELAGVAGWQSDGTGGRAGDPAHELPFRFAGSWRRLLGLRTATGAHAVVVASAPRPAALLDDGALKRLMAIIGHVRSLHPKGTFRTVRLSAAGADSSTFRRMRERVATETGLEDVEEGGDLLLRVRHAPHGEGFELTARISPRPLSARAWRRCNLPGALNATVAAVLVDLTQPAPDDVFLNLGCGSGTLLIERALSGQARRLIGCDTDPSALACAAENVAGAGLSLSDGASSEADNAPLVEGGSAGVELQPWDATALPLPDGSVDALVVDLPFGQLVGSHATNELLYPALLAEAARVARPGARLVAITQQIRLFERCVLEQAASWQIEQALRLTIPTNAAPISLRVFVLHRA